MDTATAMALINQNKSKLPVIIGVIGAAVVGFLVYRKIKAAKEAKAAEEQRNKDISASQQTIDKLAAAGLQTTLNDVEVLSLKDKLYNAMKDTGTDNDAIAQCFARIQTKGDWYAVMKAFGTPAYGTFGAPVFGSGTPLDLIGWCREELSGEYLKKAEDLQRLVDETGIHGISGIGSTRAKKRAKKADTFIDVTDLL